MYGRKNKFTLNSLLYYTVPPQKEIGQSELEGETFLREDLSSWGKGLKKETLPPLPLKPSRPSIVVLTMAAVVNMILKPCKNKTPPLSSSKQNHYPIQSQKNKRREIIT